MKFDIIIILLLLTYTLSAQQQTDTLSYHEQRKLLEFAYKESVRQNSLEPFDNLYNSNKITDTRFKFFILLDRAQRMISLDSILSHDNIYDSLTFTKKVNKIVDNYQLIYNSFDNYYLKTIAIYKRFELLDNIIYKYKKEVPQQVINFYKTDLDNLKQIGYKEEKFSTNLGIWANLSTTKWVGVEFSVFSYYKSVFVIKGIYEGRAVKAAAGNKLPHGANMLNISIGHALYKNSFDFSLSLLEITAPAVIIPAKFGIQTFEGRVMPYYRPTIGISVGPLSFSYSYNIVFYKKDRVEIDKNVFFLWYSFPIINHRNNFK